MAPVRDEQNKKLQHPDVKVTTILNATALSCRAPGKRS